NVHILDGRQIALDKADLKTNNVGLGVRARFPSQTGNRSPTRQFRSLYTTKGERIRRALVSLSLMFPTNAWLRGLLNGYWLVFSFKIPDLTQRCTSVVGATGACWPGRTGVQNCPLYRLSLRGCRDQSGHA